LAGADALCGEAYPARQRPSTRVRHQFSSLARARQQRRYPESLFDLVNESRRALDPLHLTFDHRAV